MWLAERRRCLRVGIASLLAGAVCCASVCLAAQPALDVGKPVLLPTKGLSSVPAVAYGDGVYLVVWQEGRHGLGGESDVCAARVARGGKVLDDRPIVVCRAPGAQCTPAVAYTRADKVFLVVWADLGGLKDYDVLAARVDRSGKCLDAKPIAISVQRGVNEAQCRIASDKVGFLVTWASSKTVAGGPPKPPRPAYEIRARRVDRTGGVLGEAPILVADAGHDPDVASNGESYCVVFTSGRDAHAVRLSLAGKVLDPKPIEGITCRWAGCPDHPVVAATRHGYVAVGSRAPRPDRWGRGGPGAFLGGRITPNGDAPESRIKLSGWQWGLITDEKLDNVVDTCRWGKADGAELVRAWPMGQAGGFKCAYRNEWPYAHSAIAADGKGGCLVAWMLGHLVGTVNVQKFDIRVRHVDPFGGWEKGPKTSAAATSADEVFPAIAAGGDDEFLLAYELIEPGKPPVVAFRIITLKRSRP